MKKVYDICVIFLLCGMACQAQNKQDENIIIPGVEWKDTNKNRINAHGGGMLWRA